MNTFLHSYDILPQANVYIYMDKFYQFREWKEFKKKWTEKKDKLEWQIKFEKKAATLNYRQNMCLDCENTLCKCVMLNINKKKKIKEKKTRTKCLLNKK